VLGEDNPILAEPLLSIAYARLQLGENSLAESEAQDALERLQAVAPGSYLEGIAQCLVGLALEGQDKPELGGTMVNEAHKLLAFGATPEPYRSGCRVPAPSP
jgi:hypothetical protein